MSETDIGQKFPKIPKLMPDYSADGYNYLPGPKTSPKINDKGCELMIFSHLSNLKKQN